MAPWTTKLAVLHYYQCLCSPTYRCSQSDVRPGRDIAILRPRRSILTAGLVAMLRRAVTRLIQSALWLPRRSPWVDNSHTSGMSYLGLGLLISKVTELSTQGHFRGGSAGRACLALLQAYKVEEGRAFCRS